MAGSEVTAARPGRLLPRLPPDLAGLSALRVTWSVPAVMRAVRATLVVPGLFALTDKVIGSPQMVLFAVFGGFASLVLAAFGGTRRDKLIAHLGLAVTGSVVLTIGTAVSGITWLAALVTIPVAFGLFFAGVAGPNAASGVTAALLAYVLPVASVGTVSAIPDRLAGWWLASVVSTAAVLLLSPRSPGDRLRGSAAASAAALATQLDAVADGAVTPEQLAACTEAKHNLMTTFAATPYRPTGLATADQALGNIVQLLEWCTVLVSDTLDGHLEISQAAEADRGLLRAAAGLLRAAGALLSGQDAEPDIARMEAASAASTARQRSLSGDPADADGARAAARFAFHAQAIAVAARAVAEDALIATRRATPEVIATARREWFGEQQPAGPVARRRAAGLAGALGIVSRHASFRSVWLLNSVRGAVGLAAAVAVADLSGVQHGFWVVLGTLSVLRTNAASTGSTAVRAFVGTVLGFVVGAALLLGIGTGQAALWIALPAAVFIAAYAPGTAPFTIGQAAFTITVVVLFNLLAPAGWKVGLLRIQDVAIGCAVSLVVGVLFWPRGAGSVVSDDLADAYRSGGAYLSQAVDWALGLRGRAPDTAISAATAGIRLDDALRAYLAEQGSKRVPKHDLWMLVMASLRLRLTAHSLAALRGQGSPAYRDAPLHVDEARAALRALTADLVGFYDEIAAQVGRPASGEPELAEVPVPSEFSAAAQDGGVPHHHPHTLWVREHLLHLGQHVAVVPVPALHVAELRRTPWWR
ncbi:MAG TPA: FUSC family protein [Streptosporangiaceae bacterium]